MTPTYHPIKEKQLGIVSLVCFQSEIKFIAWTDMCSGVKDTYQ